MFHYPYRLFLISLVLLFLKCCECTFPYLIGEHRSGGGVPVFVSVRVNDKVFFSTRGEHEIAQLRNKLQSIYPVKTPGLLSLSVNTISFDLISSPVLISKNFTVNYKAKHVKQNKRFTAQRHDYHPYCNYVASSDAVFNLCSGVNGHFTDDDKYYKIKSNVSKGSVTHFQTYRHQLMYHRCMTATSAVTCMKGNSLTELLKDTNGQSQLCITLKSILLPTMTITIMFVKRMRRIVLIKSGATAYTQHFYFVKTLTSI